MKDNNITIDKIKQYLVNLNVADLKRLGDMLAQDMGYDGLSALLSASAASGAKDNKEEEIAQNKEKSFKIIFKSLKEGQTMAAVKKVKEFFSVSLIEAKKKIGSEFVITESCDESTKVTILQEWSLFAEIAVENSTN